jgi:branched-chain amino acid transport system substrate-binding protein
MLLALDEVNRKADLTGGKILELDIRDASNRPRDTRNIISHFIKDKQYPIIIGGGGSSTASIAANICQRNRTPLIVINGSEDGITKPGLSYVFRIAPPRSHYGDAAIEFIREVVKPSKIALVTEMSEFGETIRNVLQKVARDEGWKVVYETRIDIGITDLTRIRDGMDGSDADAVFLVVFPPEATRIMEEVRLASPGSILISFVPASVLHGAFLVCGRDCSGVFSSALWLSKGEGSASSFREKYMEKYGSEPDYHGAQAYAAVLVASLALRDVDETDKAAVRDSLEKTRIGSPMGTVAFQNWGGFGNQNRPKSYLFQWFDNRYEVVWPEIYRTAEPIMPGKR